MSGLTGEAAAALQFDLYVQGFAFTNAESAQYLIAGSNNGNLQAKASDAFNKRVLVSKAYSGASLRRQVHAFADDFVQALSRKPIAQTKIAFKGGSGAHSEIYVSDFDGHDALAVTKDGSLVAAPCWVPGHLALYYVSYKLDNTDIFYHDLSTGARRAFARFGGSNISPAAAPPNGARVAMILSKDGWVDLYVSNADGSDLKRLTRSRQDESSPCWSPDGKYHLFRGQRERAPGALQSLRLGRSPADRHDRRHPQPHRARLVPGRQVDRLHRPIPLRLPDLRRARPGRRRRRPGRGRRPLLGPQLPHPGLLPAPRRRELCSVSA